MIKLPMEPSCLSGLHAPSVKTIQVWFNEFPTQTGGAHSTRTKSLYLMESSSFFFPLPSVQNLPRFLMAAFATLPNVKPSKKTMRPLKRSACFESMGPSASMLPIRDLSSSLRSGGGPTFSSLCWEFDKSTWRPSILNFCQRVKISCHPSRTSTPAVWIGSQCTKRIQEVFERISFLLKTLKSS